MKSTLIRILAFAAMSFASANAALAQDQPVAIVNAKVFSPNGPVIEEGGIVFENGRILRVAAQDKLSIPENAHIIDAQGQWLTPGIVDPHTHIGNFPTPSVPATMDLNEKTGINTAEISVADAIWPQDPGFDLVRAGGVTTLAVLPGSTNLVAGRGVVLKNRPAATVQEMKFEGAPELLKMACGENPIKVYGGKGKTPFTRMGVMAAFRDIWRQAKQHYDKSDDKKFDDSRLGVMARAIAGEYKIIVHCYRADEMANLIDISNEYGFKISSFHHAVEAYKIADLLAEQGIGVATWSRRWGFKLEAYDSIEALVAFLQDKGVDAVLHSDAAILTQHMNMEAAISYSLAQDAGFEVTEQKALGWITQEPANQLGIGDKVGSIEPGKMADIVLWSSHPFDVYSRPQRVFIEGEQVYAQRSGKPPHSDFMIGQSGEVD
ncbi:amidohydrolase family protein [Hirschia baltica]|uniref:Amidohydrolase n=1 Tax=Hirschia baltica (strain ATCC 49814 / DSM 5838 / IFAM 1418) TaxID=582402 RepID=C6XPN7_HIRBI|nr:amidohydrolase family protein [Hirschia baltica]ACT60302.1 amidohydrolase [Hirschia baltica ATCC 49814]